MPVTIDLYENPLLRPWFDRAHERGVEEGIEKGIERGRGEGKQEMLLAQLGEKFGPLSSETVRRVETASVTELAKWGSRVLAANSIDAVFG